MNRSRSRSPAPAASRRIRVSYEQLEALIEYMEQNRELATGYFNSTAGRRKATRHWARVAQSLNAIGGGTIKDAKGWSAYWSDFKNKLKKKTRTIQLAITGTGGGPPKTQTYSDLDLRVLRVLGNNFSEALPGVMSTLASVFSDESAVPHQKSASSMGNQNEVGSPDAATPEPGTVFHPTATAPAIHVESLTPRTAVVAPPAPAPRVDSPRLHSASARTVSPSTSTSKLARRIKRRRCSPPPSTIDTALAAVKEMERQQVRNAAAMNRLAAAVEDMAAAQRAHTEAVRAATAAIQAAAAAFVRALEIYEIANGHPRAA